MLVKRYEVPNDLNPWQYEGFKIKAYHSDNGVFAAVRHTDNEICHAHVFGCPVYVLDASLQDGKKIPKWNPRACLGLFLGFSDLHSSLVPLVLNVVTGHISPQFHVIFDDKFETVNSLPIDQPLNKLWAEIFRLGCECCLDVDYDENDQRIIPPLLDIIKSYSKAQADLPFFEPIRSFDVDDIQVKDASVPPPHELLQDGQAANQLNKGVISQVVLPPTFPVPGGELDYPYVPMVPVVTPSVPSMAPVPSSEENHNGELLHGSPVQDLTAAGRPR